MLQIEAYKRKGLLRGGNPLFVVLQLEFCQPSHFSAFLFSSIYWKNSYSAITSPKTSCSLQPTPIRVQYHPHRQSYSSLWRHCLGQTEPAKFGVISFSLILCDLLETFNMTARFSNLFPQVSARYHLRLASFCFPNISFSVPTAGSSSSAWPLNIWTDQRSPPCSSRPSSLLRWPSPVPWP